MPTERCAARDGEHPTLHTCDDPLACALDSLGPVEETEAEYLAGVVERVRELIAEPRWARTRLAAELLRVVEP